MRKKIIYTLLAIFILLFAFTNYIAYNHAYNFTHFSKSKTGKWSVTENTRLSLKRKLKLMFSGVEIPKPLNEFTPNFSYMADTIPTEKGNLEVWTNDLSHKAANGTIIMFHGYANNKSSLIARADWFIDLDYKVVLVDFLGCGGSDGHSCTVGYEEADQVRSVLRYCQERGDSNIYLFGISMGAVSIMKCLKDQPENVKGIILECPFGYFKTTIDNRFKQFGIPSFPMSQLLMFWGSYHTGYWTFNHNPVDYAKKIDCPVLLMHGEFDPAVTHEEMRKMWNNFKSTKKYWETFGETGHDVFRPHSREQWNRATQNFLEVTGTYEWKIEMAY